MPFLPFVKTEGTGWGGWLRRWPVSPKRESAGEFPGHGNKKSCAIDGATNKVASGAISAKRNKQSAGWGRGKESPKYERTGEFLERDNRA